MNVLQGALMGLIQGLGEFLPVSSSGHLLLARFFLGLEGTTPEAQSAFKVLDILLHVGTLIPLLIVFRKEWFDMILHPVKNKTFFLLVLASVPTLVIYLAAKILFPDVDGFDVFNNGWFLGASFLITALFLLICDYPIRPPMATNSGANTTDTIVMSLIRMLMDGPEVSLNGSPTVSPTTVAL